MRTVCKSNQCAGCHVCTNVCSKNAIRIEDTVEAYNAVIDEQICINCGRCETVCPVNHPVGKIEPIKWAQGWALNEKIREGSSSGGIAAALQYGFVKNNGAVCSCVFDQGKFVFDFAFTAEDVKKFSGSKYVKSNPEKAYAQIKMLLSEGKKVLFVGLPCQCAAVKKYVKDHTLLYTVDLICHGSPSPITLEMFLSEKGCKIETLKEIRFRKKMKFCLSDERGSLEPSSVRDRYTMAFLKALCYTENCYSCQYARKERVSDLSLGDSWGSTLDVSEAVKGISLILCQTAKGEELIATSDVHLESVNIECAIFNNKQLSRPSKKPPERELFLSTLMAKKNFSKAVKKCYPKDCFRQSVKAILIKAKLWHSDERN